LGLHIGGGKTDKTELVSLEYYPEHKKLFLNHIEEKIQSRGQTSGDQILFELITKNYRDAHSLAINVPTRVPKCLRCKIDCPGFEKCTEPEILWMWKHYNQKNQKRKPDRLFTPYTERCVDFYVGHLLEEKFGSQHALGANLAPLTARAHFLKRRIKNVPIIEVNPELSLWRLGRSLGINRSYLRTHTKSVGGLEARQAILKQLIDRDIAFFYNQDQKVLVERAEVFNAFICAVTGLLKYKGLVEKRPVDFPKGEAWIAIPKEELSWP
jgi:hypothetical protein